MRGFRCGEKDTDTCFAYLQQFYSGLAAKHSFFQWYSTPPSCGIGPGGTLMSGFVVAYPSSMFTSLVLSAGHFCVCIPLEAREGCCKACRRDSEARRVQATG